MNSPTSRLLLGLLLIASGFLIAGVLGSQLGEGQTVDGSYSWLQLLCFVVGMAFASAGVFFLIRWRAK